ncbi:MAG: YfhO family protein [Bacteroidota bacterium]
MASIKKEKPSKLLQNAPAIPLKYQHAAAITVIFLSLVIFFHELVFDGKVFVAADSIASKSFHTLVSDAAKEGIFPLWNPYIFCGMPGYASLSVHGDRYFDVTALVVNRAAVYFGHILNNPDIGWELLYYLIFGIGIYWFVFDKLKNKIAALIAALGVMHSTFIVILIIVGHMTKVPVIAFFPFIFIILERLREKFNIVLSLVLIILIHLMLIPSHMQMIFYCYFAFGLYYLFFFVRAIIYKENWQGIIRSASIFAVATGLAFAMTGDQYLSTLEYSKYSIRGSDPIIRSQQSQEKAPSNGGLDYDYATNWSFSPSEMLTFFIPSSHGFGWFSYRGVLTQNQETRLNTYFGNMPFTDAPQYMGIVIIVLAGIGFWRNKKDPFVQYTALLIVISLFISFGKEFSLFYDLMFNYFPMFNKFRIPSMILILVQIMIPILSAYGFMSLIGDGDEKNLQRKKIFEYILVGIGVLLIASVVTKDIFLSIYDMFFPRQEIMQSLARSYNQTVVGELYKVIAGMISSDITYALLFLLISLGSLYLYQSKKIKYSLVALVVVAVMLLDLWRVNYKPMDPKPHTDSQDVFATPKYVSFIKRDTTLYRTLEFEQGQPPYNNTLAYWRIQSAYGYQGVKMRQIQDMFDVAGLGNPLVWGLMNVKYILSDRLDSNQILQPVFSSEGKYVLYNRSVLPRAFFVNRYEVAKGLDILQKIKEMNFDPQEVAFFMDDLKLAIDAPQAGAEATYTHFGIQDIALRVKATGNNLLFLSESWYPAGWKAFIDGHETPIHRINYMFRGVVVPVGEHSLTMKFEPVGFVLGKQLSLWTNIIIVGLVGFFSFRRMRTRKKQNLINE